MHSPIRLCLFLCFLAFWSGCAEDVGPVGLLVVVDAQGAVRSELERIEVRTSTTNARFFVNRAPSGETARSFPFSFELALRGKASGKAEIRAFSENGERVRRTIVLTGSGKGRRVLRVLLSDGCAGRFASCDVQGKGTCIDCGPGCESETVVFDTLVAAGANDGIDLTASDRCQVAKPTDGGGDASNESDAAQDSGVTDSDGGGGTGGTSSGTSGGGGTTGGTSSGTSGSMGALTLEIANVVAAPGCVPITVTRAAASPLPSEAISFDLGSPARATLWRDRDCAATPETSAAFAEDATTATYYLAPNALSGPRVQSLRIVAQTASEAVERTVSLRMRAVRVVRGAGVGCALLWDGSVHCAGKVDGEHYAFIQHILSREDGLYGGVLLPARARKLSGIDRNTVLSAAGDTACALASGKVTCWGNNQHGNLGDASTTSSTSNQDVLGLGTGVDQIDVGGSTSCAVRRSDHKMFCWGDNRERQCTAADVSSYPTPVEVTLAGVTGNIEECASSGVYTCARLEAGDVYCWGRNAQSGPVKIDLDGFPARHVDASGGAVCAVVVVAGQDRIYCWDWDSAGEAKRITGYPVTAKVKAFAPHFEASCAHVGDELYCWGRNPTNWLGTESASEILTSASRVPLSGKVESIALGESGGISVSAVVDGLVYVWGYFAGGLGIDDKLGLFLSPTLVPVLSNIPFDALTLSESTGCGIHAGNVSCWGSGYAGELGNGKNGIMGGQFSNAPVALANLQSGLVRQVEAFSSGHLALEDSDKLYTWGYNGAGQDGGGVKFGNLLQPQLSTSLQGIAGTVVQVAASGFRGCARTEDGAVSCWGMWGDETLRPSAVTSAQQGVSDLALNEREGCLLVNQSVTCFQRSGGAFSSRAITVLGDDVTDIDMSGTSFCAKKGDRAFCALNGAAEEATETFASGVSEVRVGRWHACARKTDGTLSCAGFNDFAQQGQGDANPGLRGEAQVGLTSPVGAFDCVENLTCARDAVGMKCWGENTRNQMSLEPFAVTVPTLLAPFEND